ncbi:MAG: histidinol-phosphate aminotransferase [Planctomycetota bacterium]|jgi:histidinol-phosphate aminotransferase
MSDFAAKYDPGVQIAAEEALCLHRNENLFVSTDWTVKTAREMIERAAIGSYPDANSDNLRTALAELYGVEQNNIFVGNGSDEVLADLLGLLRPKYDTVHCLDACFKVYDMLAERMDFKQAVLPGDTFNTGHVTAPNFDGLALIDSPNALTGRSVPKDEILGLASNPDAFLIWDNVYGEYAGDELPAPPAKNTVYVRSFSKFYGLAGLRVGYCIADADLISALMERKDVFNVNGFGQVMALEAIKRRAEFEALRDQLVECRLELIEKLRELGFVVPTTDYVAVLATHPDFSAELLQAKLLERKVVVRRFAGEVTSNFIRITVSPRPTMQQFLQILGEIVSA